MQNRVYLIVGAIIDRPKIPSPGEVWVFYIVGAIHESPENWGTDCHVGFLNQGMIAPGNHCY